MYCKKVEDSEVKCSRSSMGSEFSVQFTVYKFQSPETASDFA